MSMIYCLQQIDATKIDDLLLEPEGVHDLLEEGYETRTDLDKSWHGLHFLLAGSAWEGEWPLNFLLCGGEPVGEEDVGYGPAHVLRPGQVMECSAALQAIDAEEIKRRYNPTEMTRAEIYPDMWDRKEEHEENLDYLIENFNALKAFISQAAQEQKGVIASLR